MTRPGLDQESSGFHDEVDALVRAWAHGDEHELAREAARKLVDQQDAGRRRQEECAQEAAYGEDGWTVRGLWDAVRAGGAAMHRLDVSHAHVRAINFGYSDGNIVLVCAGCHEWREAERR